MSDQTFDPRPTTPATPGSATPTPPPAAPSVPSASAGADSPWNAARPAGIDGSDPASPDPDPTTAGAAEPPAAAPAPFPSPAPGADAAAGTEPGATATLLLDRPMVGDPWAPPTTPGGSDPLTSTGGTPRRGRALVAAVAATALVAGLAGGAVGIVATRDSGTTASSTFSLPRTGGAAAVSLPEGSVAQVAAKVLPSVVSIEERSGNGGGSGSGVVIDAQGLILTNNHVIEGAADGQGSLTVTLNDGRTASATIVGRDPSSDLAVLRVSGLDNLTAIAIGSSADLTVGQTVVAVGSPLGLSGTVTSGIVSALNRPVVTGGSGSGEGSVLNAVQTDAAINPGNSGGALVDLEGRLVGINSAIATLSGGGGQSGSIGLGFAIPVDQASKVAEQLVRTGSVQQARLGVSTEDVTTPLLGARLTQVASGGAADTAGLRVGDVVISYGDQRIDGADSLVAAVRSSSPGDKVEVRYSRGGDEATVTVTLGSATTTP